jgi:hypothetical protein
MNSKIMNLLPLNYKSCTSDPLALFWPVLGCFDLHVGLRRHITTIPPSLPPSHLGPLLRPSRRRLSRMLLPPADRGRRLGGIRGLWCSAPMQGTRRRGDRCEVRQSVAVADGSWRRRSLGGDATAAHTLGTVRRSHDTGQSPSPQPLVLFVPISSVMWRVTWRQSPTWWSKPPKTGQNNARGSLVHGL